MEEYWSGLVSCAVVAGACAPRATVAGAPGAAREGVERVEAFRNIGIPCPGQDRANFPYQLSAPDSVEIVAGVFLFPVAVVAVVGEEDTLKAVAQLVVAAPLCLEVPARIASHSSPVALLVSVLVVAGVVVVLRFPLCLLYRSMFNQCLSGFYLLFFSRSDAVCPGINIVCQAYHNWGILARVGGLYVRVCELSRRCFCCGSCYANFKWS